MANVSSKKVARYVFVIQKPAINAPKGGHFGSLALGSGQGSVKDLNLWEHSQTMPTLRGLNAVNVSR